MANPPIIFIVLIVLAVAWAAATNPPPKGGLLSGLAPAQSGSGGIILTETPTDTASISYELQKVQQEASRIQREIDANKRAAESSTLSKDIFFYASGAWSTDPATEYLMFTLSPSHVGKVLITGLEVRSSATGKGIIIPKGVELPFAGVLNQEDPIYISPGETVYLITGRSPTGYSFRVNKCSGYFSQFQTYTPFLPNECPAAADYKVTQTPGYFNDQCLDYLQRVPRCSIVLNNLDTAYLQSECQTFIREKLNYKACTEDFKNDPTFYRNEWRVYLNQNEELWKSKREIIKLLDATKKTIGTVTY